ncbi:hypothetical protein M409DRAFT_24442 [Zasmidium cellare ATCC 36951]|uniref:Ankyrin repeat protein n=1 Tax=Zasmidium cellare ATCC 36951 TaxID=1080233 RepID=A0A6A6CHZ8_ZASCE|nr:uncharacterized protein M409DRAFT_24442 [Zasmidium cellare ATCC 36951]KAF2165056.1 hypothetical protein M409DRAFT_24442 [Zasmidium cellare ATCC 36951]
MNWGERVEFSYEVEQEFEKFPRRHPERSFYCSKGSDLTLMSAGDLEAVTPWIREQSSGFTWLHVPENNGLFLLAVIKWALSGNILREHETAEGMKLTSEILGTFRLPSVTPGDPSLDYRTPMSSFEWRFLLNQDDGCCIVLPCFVLRSSQAKDRMREDFEMMRSQVPANRARWMMQIERTLDEAHFPGLGHLFFDQQNRKQVVSREFKKNKSKEEIDVKNIPILMVSQVWLWSSKNWLISSFAMPDAETQGGGSREVTGTLENQMLFKHPSEQVIHLVAEFIEQFGKRTTRGGGDWEPALGYFEIGVVRIFAEVEEYVRDSTNQIPNITKEREFLHDIADIKHELALIQHVLDQQMKIIKNMAEAYDSEAMKELPPGALPYYKKRFNITKGLVEDYTKAVTKISADAERIEQMIKTQLELKRTQANIQDTQNSLLLSTAAIGFAVITIIFTPLAFMASLFALPLEGFKDHQKGEGEDAYFETSYVGKWFSIAEVVSLVVTALVVVVSLAALRWDSIKRRFGFNQVAAKVEGMLARKGKAAKKENENSEPGGKRRSPDEEEAVPGASNSRP